MIDYKILADSTEFYDSKGFSRIEAPWTVTKGVSDITRPKTAIDWEIKHNDKVLAASAEQSFLYLYLKGFLPKGRFQAITPCFRFENFDFLHTKYFMKNELIETKNVNRGTLTEILDNAVEFFSRYLDNVEVSNGPDESFDIEWKGHELGSYGIRSCQFLDWIYGTGVAEPRLSSLVQLSRKSK